MATKPRKSLEDIRAANIGRMLQKLDRRFTRDGQVYAAEVGVVDITVANISIFAYITEQGVRISSIAKSAGISKPAAGKIVEDLHTKGYVDLLPDPTDGRATLVRFSAKGINMIEKVQAATKAIEREWIAALGAKKIKQLKETMEELLEFLDE